jgi:hypothetical protein
MRGRGREISFDTNGAIVKDEGGGRHKLLEIAASFVFEVKQIIIV